MAETKKKRKRMTSYKVTALDVARACDSYKDGSPGQYMAICPVHNDTNPSLSIKDANGKVLIKCFSNAGCQYKDIVEALSKRGLEINSSVKSPKHTTGLPPGIATTFNNKQFAAKWTWRDEHGEIIGYTVRYEGEKLKQTGKRAKDVIPYFQKKGIKWVAKAPKGERKLYNLDLISDAEEGEQIYVVEGEKKADLLVQLGLTATYSLGGSNAAAKTDWTPLANKQVVIWADNDEAGKVYESNVFRELVNVGESTLIVEAIDTSKLDLEEGGDVYDYYQKNDNVTKETVQNLERIEVSGEKDLGIIIVDPADVAEAYEEAEKLLLKKAPYEIFQRCNEIVRVRKSSENQIGLAEVTKDYFTDLLSRHITFVQETKDGYKQIDPPAKITNRYFARSGHWDLHTLEGLIYAPTLRPEKNTLISEPGYDKETGIYFVDNEGKNIKVQDEPTKEDAQEALKKLNYILQDFPFVTEADKSVVLAAILTSLVRKSFKIAPAFGISAPNKGAGKTLLSDIVHIIATGHQVTPIDLGFNKEEQQKQLFAKLLEGNPVITIDNVDMNIRSGYLCSVITAPDGKHSGRILGASETKQVPTTVTILINGNNLIFQGDMTDRVLLCTIDPKCEEPRQRDNFKIKNLSQYVRKFRRRYIEAALTIMRAYEVAGKPRTNVPAMDFKQWSRLVRESLVWLGCEDPYKTQLRAKQEDPEKQNHKAIMELWSEIYDFGVPVTVSDIVEDCNRALENKVTTSNEYQLAVLLLDVSYSKGKQLTNRAIGNYLSRKKNAPIDDMKIVKSKKRTNNLGHWEVVNVI